MDIRLVPDGAVLDHVGEFMFEDRDRLQILFWNDYEGYKDAVANIVQLLASSATLVGGNRKPLINGTFKLKEQLAESNRLATSNFFSDSSRDAIQASAKLWLAENWEAILSELRDPNSSALTAAIGHLKREFYYAWILKHEGWKRERYASPGATVSVPAALLQKFAGELAPLTEGRGVSPQLLTEWMDENLVSHYRIFGEYFLFLGNDNRDEYLPALTRSSLALLTIPGHRNKLEQLVLPFVGLMAVKSVTNRKDLVKRVLEWREREGREIAEGLDEMQKIFRTISDEEEKDKLLRGVGDNLRANITNTSRMIVSCLKVVKMDFGATEDVVTAVRLSQNYRWLCKLQNPAVNEAWKAELERLVRT